MAGLGSTGRVVGYAKQEPCPCAYYRSAGVFCFPRLRREGRIVARKLPSALLMAPMGAGRKAIDGSTGVVVNPLEEEAWTAAMRAPAGDPKLRWRLPHANGLAIHMAGRRSSLGRVVSGDRPASCFTLNSQGWRECRA